jgi:DNA-binding NarL/FixJ family response regulator
VTAVAILSADPVLRRRLQRLPQADPTVTLAGLVEDSASLLRLLDRESIDVVLIDRPTGEHLAQWNDGHRQPPLLALLETGELKDAFRLLNAGATAVLGRSATNRKIAAAIAAAASGLVVIEPKHLGKLQDETPFPREPLESSGSEEAPLTPRELEVLAAMADGASNKAIARRLGISFSTVKFHVASILAKLDAESRTEAVMKAAQSGLIML